jgi:hypothetical protein
MSKLILSDLANLQNEQTAVTTINANNTLVETAIEKTLSRDGTAPNQMTALLDMNFNHIINLPAPAGPFEPIRLADVSGGGTTLLIVGTTPISNGTSGRILYNNAGILQEVSTTGTGNVVLSQSPTLTGTITAVNAGFSGNLGVTATTPSFSVFTGALTIAGGAGIQGDVYARAGIFNDGIRLPAQPAGVAMFDSGGVLFSSPAPAASLVIGSSTIIGGATGRVLYNNAGILNEIIGTGSGSVAFNTSPTFAGIPLAPTAAPGTNTTQLATTAFVNAAVSGSTTALVVGLTAISGGVSGRVLYNNAGTLNELLTTGTGSVVFQTAPTIVTPLTVSGPSSNNLILSSAVISGTGYSGISINNAAFGAGFVNYPIIFWGTGTGSPPDANLTYGVPTGFGHIFDIAGNTSFFIQAARATLSGPGANLVLGSALISGTGYSGIATNSLAFGSGFVSYPNILLGTNTGSPPDANITYNVPAGQSHVFDVGGNTAMTVSTGFVTLVNAPTNPLHAATKAYVDSISGGGGAFLPLTGGTLTGALTVNSSVTVNGPGQNLVLNSALISGSGYSGISSNNLAFGAGFAVYPHILLGTGVGSPVDSGIIYGVPTGYFHTFDVNGNPALIVRSAHTDVIGVGGNLILGSPTIGGSGYAGISINANAFGPSFPNYPNIFLGTGTGSPVDLNITYGVPTGYNHIFDVNGTAAVVIRASGTGSTSPSTGTLTVTGGLGVAGGINASGDISTYRSASPALGVYFFGNTGSKYLIYNGSRYSFNGGPLDVPDTTVSSSPSTGALTVGGGLGVAGNVYAGQLHSPFMFFNDNDYIFTDGTSIILRTNVSFIFQNVAGTVGLGVLNNTGLSLPQTTPSTSPTTGALTVAGGLGIGGAVNIGNASGTLALSSATITGSGYSGISTNINAFGSSFASYPHIMMGTNIGSPPDQSIIYGVPTGWFHTLEVNGIEKLAVFANKIEVPAVGTTASAANAFIDNAANNSLLRSTSSIRYKRDVRELTDEEAEAIIMKARPIKYRSRCEADDPTIEHIGFIAEEFDKIDSRLVSRDANGLGGVQYDRIVAPLLAIVRQQQIRIAALEKRLAA